MLATNPDLQLLILALMLIAFGASSEMLLRALRGRALTRTTWVALIVGWDASFVGGLWLVAVPAAALIYVAVGVAFTSIAYALSATPRSASRNIRNAAFTATRTPAPQ